MKKLIFLLFFISPFPLFASDFSNLEYICQNTVDGQYTANKDNLILKHIQGRITKANGYVKTNDYLYVVANTFSDNYRFLGSYFMRYDCKDQTTKILSRALKKNFSGEMGFIQYSNDSNAILIRHSGSFGANAAWIYDLETEKLLTINSRKIQPPVGYKLSWVVLLDTYDGDSIQIQKSYYTGNFQYINLINPDFMTYYF